MTLFVSSRHVLKKTRCTQYSTNPYRYVTCDQNIVVTFQESKISRDELFIAGLQTQCFLRVVDGCGAEFVMQTSCLVYISSACSRRNYTCVYVCIDLLFQHPRGGVLFGIQMQCPVVHPSGARNCEWSQVLRYEGLLLTNKAGCGEAVCTPGAKAAWYADVGLSCRWKLRQHPWTMESIWGHRAWTFLVILRWSWNRGISKHQLLLAWESNYFCSPHHSTKLPINHPKTIQTSIRPFLWHDEQLYTFTAFNSKWIIYFHDILPISKRFKWNSYIDGDPRCLQLNFTRHRRSMLPNVFGVLLWDSWKQTNKQIIPQWQLFLENWMFYWKVWNSILGMWHSDVFWVVWLSRNFLDKGPPLSQHAKVSRRPSTDVRGCMWKSNDKESEWDRLM